MDKDNSLNKKEYKFSINLDDKKICFILQNKEDLFESYQNNYSFDQLIEKQIKLISYNNIDIILNLINSSIEADKYSILRDESNNNINIIFQIKNELDNSVFPLNLQLFKNNEMELIKMNLNDLNKEVKKLRKENEELRKENEEMNKEVKYLKDKAINNAVLLVPGEHSQWDKRCPYCNSSDIKKNMHYIIKVGILE